MEQFKSHNTATSHFLVKLLHEKITPEQAALIRPINFNDKYFNDENKIDKMLQLKGQMLNIYFRQYHLSAFQKIKCCTHIWGSQYPLSKLRATKYQKMILKNTRFSYNIMENQLGQKKARFFLYFIGFCILLLKMILIKMYQEILLAFNRVICKKSFSSI